MLLKFFNLFYDIKHSLQLFFIISPIPDIRLLTEEGEAGHGHRHGVHVDGPKVHEEDDLELDVRLPADGDAAAHVGVLAVPEQEKVSRQTKNLI